MNELVREVARLNPPGSTANRCMSEVVVQTDGLRIEVLHGHPQIPHAAANEPVGGVRVIHGGRAVFLIETDEAGDTRLQSLDLLREIT